MTVSRTILLTSFGAFPGAAQNPTEAVAALAAGLCARRLQRIGLRLVTAHLAVVFVAIPRDIAALHAAHKPRAVLHLGLAVSRKTMTPEARAVNRLSLRHADAGGAWAASAVIARGRPGVLTATFPAARLARILQGTGIDARVSRNAGSYVCNQALYLMLLRAPLACQVGFIHLPHPHPLKSGRPSSRAGARPLLTLRHMAAGVAACLMAMARPRGI